MAAVIQIPAAVVRPRISRRSDSFRIAPAPRKPTPAATPWITRETSPGADPTSTAAITNSAAPSDTSMWVRRPASLPVRARS